MMNDDRFLNTKETAKYLGLAEGTLRQARMNGRREHRIPPPPFIRLGRKILYRLSDLETWLNEHTVKSEGM